ncbi:hypothetical protein AAK967_08500 [Atopobiaceae bacterium 24-176]
MAADKGAGEMTPRKIWDDVVSDACEKAREGAPAGTKVRWHKGVTTRAWFGPRRTRPADAMYLAVLARPKVPMGFFDSLATVGGLGAVEGLRSLGADARLAWPATVVDGSGRFLGSVRCRAGYGEGGVFIVASAGVNVGEGEYSVPQDAPEPLEPVSVVDLVGPDDAPAAEDAVNVVCDAVAAAIDRWEQGIAAGQGAAGPLGPVLGDWFDEMPLMGQPVRVLLPDGREVAAGALVGIDGWGRVTVRTDDGSELEFSSGQVFLRPR